MTELKTDPKQQKVPFSPEEPRPKRGFLAVFREWNPTTSVLVTIGGFLVAQVASAVVIVIVSVTQGWDSTTTINKLTNSAAGMFLLSFTIYVTYLGIIRSFLKWTKHSLKDIGFKKPDSYQKVFAYMAVGFGVYFIIAAVSSSLVSKLIPGIDLEQRQDLGFSVSTTGLPLLFVFLSLVILPPLVEEIACRGFLYTGLRKKMPIWIAGIITSIIFAFAHINGGEQGAPLLWAAAIDTFILSAILIYVRQKTDNLWPAIGIHMIKNGLAFLLLFILRVA